MSTTIDERIVKMGFDDSGFEAGANEAISILGKLENALKLEDASAGLENVRNSMSKFNASPVVQGAEQIKAEFSVLDTFVSGVVVGWGKKFADWSVNVAKHLVKTITDPVTDGFKEYEAQMRSVQTISANSGESLEVIQQNLDALNEYADKTVYVFSDMTSAIGRFTAAGIGVEDSTKAIQGFFNAAALSGADAAAASRGVYQLSQAMSAGVVRLQDWKSIENASIDTESFRKIIMLTADQMGVADDKFKQARDGAMSFRESLASGWLTADVMQRALENLTMSTMDFEDAEEGAKQLMEQLVSQGYGEKQAQEIIAIATAADQSAREVRTWSQLMDTMKESMGSGWAQTWQLIIGNYEQSAEFFTWLSKKFEGIVSASSNARNGLLKDWQEHGGRDSLIGIVANSIEAIERVITPVIDALGEVFKITGEQLAIVTENIAYFTEGLVIGGDEMTFLNGVFFDLFTIVKSVIGFLGNGVRMIISIAVGIGRIFAPVLGVVARVFAGVAEQLAKAFSNIHAWSDRAEELVSSFVTQFVDPVVVIIKAVIDTFRDLREAFLWAFPQSEIGKKLAEIKQKISDFMSSLGILDKVKSIAKAIIRPFSVLSELITKAGGDGRLEHFKKMFAEFFGIMEKKGRPAVDVVKAGFGGLYEFVIKPLIDGLKQVYEWITSIGSIKLSGIGDLVSKSGEFLSSVISNFSLPELPNIQELLGNKIGSVRDFINDRFLSSGSFDGVFNLEEWKAIENAGYDLEEFRSALIRAAIQSGVSEEKIRSLVSSVGGFRDSLSEGWLTADIMTEALNDMSGGATVAKKSFGDFIKEFGHKVAAFAPNAIGTAITKITEAFSNLLKYFGELKSKRLGFGGTISSIFSDVYNALRRWLTSISDKSDGIKSVFAGLASSILDKIGLVPGLLSKLFGNASAAAESGVQGLSDSADAFRENASKFWTGLLDNLPSISDLGSKISDFVAGLKERFVGEVNADLSVNADVNPFGFFGTMFDLSRFSWILPDWKTPVENFINDFSSVLDLVPDDRIDELVTQFAGWAKKIGGIAFAFSGWKWLGSLTRLNNARAAKDGAFAQMLAAMPTNAESIFTNFGKNFANGVFEPIKTGLTNIGTAVRDFGKLFDPLGKKTMAKKFKDVAAGILLLAGALFVLSKVPAEDLERSAEALLKLVGVSVILLAVMGIFSALGKMDFSGVGEAFAGLGIGLLAIAGALYVLCMILSNPDLNIEDAYTKIVELMAVITLATVLIGLATKDSAMGGAAAALLAMGLALTLMLAPLYILAITSEKLFLDGIWKMAILISLLSVMAGAVAAVSSFGSIGGAAVLLALVAALTLMVIPLAILAKVPEEMYLTGLRHMMIIGLLLVALAGIISMVATNVVGIVVGTAALFALIAALTLAVIPVAILGKMSEASVNRGAIALAKISAVLALLALVVGGIGTFLPGIIVGSAGLLLIIAAVGLLSALVVVLSVFAGINQEGFDHAVWGMVWIAVALGALGAALAIAGPLMLAGVGALAGMVVAIGIMAAIVIALAYIMDLHPEAMIKGVAALAVIVAILGGIGVVGAISGAGMVILAAGIIAMSVALVALAGAIALITQVFFPGFFGELFSSFQSAGNNVGEGLSAGINNSSDGVFDAIVNLASGLWSRFCEWLGIQSPSTVMEDAGENIVQGLINGITGSEDGAFDASQLLGEESINGLLEGFGLHLDEVESLGEDGSSSFLDQFSTLPEQLGEKAQGAIDGFIEGLDTEKIKQQGVDLVVSLIDGVGEELSNRASSAIQDMFGGKLISPLFSIFGMSSESSESSVMKNTGNNVVKSFASGFGNSEPYVKGKADALANAASSGFGGLASSLFGKGSEASSNLGKGIEYGGSGISGKVKGIVDDSVGKTKDLGTKLKFNAASAMTTFGTTVESGISGAKTHFSNLVSAASTAVAPMKNKLKSEASQAMTAFANALKAGTGPAKSAVSSVMSSATSGIKSMYKQFYDVGANAVQGLINGIDGKLGKARAKADELTRVVNKAAKAGFQEKSPSRVFRGIGEYLVEGLIIGIDSLMGDAADASANLSGTVIDSFGSSLNGMAVGMDDLLDTDYNPVITPVINSAEFDSNLQQLSALMNSRLANSIDVGNVNYNETFAGKLDAVADINKQAMRQFAESAIDYDLLGVSVANALIRSGVHVEMDGGQLMGYLAGEVRDVRRMNR